MYIFSRGDEKLSVYPNLLNKLRQNIRINLDYLVVFVNVLILYDKTII